MALYDSLFSMMDLQAAQARTCKLPCKTQTGIQGYAASCAAMSSLPAAAMHMLAYLSATAGASGTFCCGMPSQKGTEHAAVALLLLSHSALLFSRWPSILVCLTCQSILHAMLG